MEVSISSSPDAASDAVKPAERPNINAFVNLVETHHRDLFRVCYTVCRDADLADEAAQATWVIAWRKLPTIREPARTRAWLLAIGANEARKLLRAHRRRLVVELSVSDPTHRTSPASAAGLDLRNALARLSADDRALLALRYVGGLNSTELSVALGLSPSGTRARLARLLERLRAELRDE